MPDTEYDDPATSRRTILKEEIAALTRIPILWASLAMVAWGCLYLLLFEGVEPAWGSSTAAIIVLSPIAVYYTVMLYVSIREKERETA